MRTRFKIIEEQAWFGSMKSAFSLKPVIRQNRVEFRDGPIGDIQALAPTTIQPIPVSFTAWALRDQDNR